MSDHFEYTYITFDLNPKALHPFSETDSRNFDIYIDDIQINIYAFIDVSHYSILIDPDIVRHIREYVYKDFIVNESNGLFDIELFMLPDILDTIVNTGICI